MRIADWLSSKHRYPVLREAVINLKDGETTFKATIFERRGAYLVLRNTTLLRGRQESKPLDGEVAVLEADVLFVQMVG